MNIKKITYLKILFFTFITLVLFSLSGRIIQASDYSDYGFISALNYSPFGTGKIRTPYQAEKIGSVSTRAENSNISSATINYSASLAWYYELFQCQFSYTCGSIDRQFIETQNSQKIDVDSEYKIWELKLGRRFSTKGSPEYTLIYLNGRILQNSLSYKRTEFTAYGCSAGFQGFYTFGLYHPLEFAVSAELYYGTYQSVDYSSQIDCISSRRYSYSAGAIIGTGLWYDPWNMAFMLTARGTIEQIAFNAHCNSSDFTAEAGSMVLNLGFEIIYHLTFCSYNQGAGH